MIAIKLGQEIGMETVAQTARRMGIQTEVERFPSTAIGAAEVIPIQLAEAYSAFATMGTKVRPFPITRVESAQGEVLWEPQPERTQVLDSLVARVMVSMLEDVVARGTGNIAVRTRAALPYEVPAAGKTGTTNDGTDAWFVGFTPTLIAAVWFGMDLPVPIRPNSTGGGDAAPVWGEFMRRVYYGSPEYQAAQDGDEPGTEDAAAAEGEADVPQASLQGPILPIPGPWPMLRGLTTRQVDSKTALLASRWCPEEEVYEEIYLPGTEPTELCDRSGRSLFGNSRPGNQLRQPR
jgi:penicillin-binding protein 1A